MNRRAVVSAAGASVLLAACWHKDRFFDIEWDEEVQLQDGRVIVIHIKHRYMRIAGRFFGFSDDSIPIDSTLTIETGTSAGKVAQYFKGFRPIFLDQHEGTWYAVLRGKYYPGSRETPGQEWGDMQGPYGQWAIRMVSGQWKPMNLCDLPDDFKRLNILQLIANAQQLSVFNKQRVALKEKLIHQIEYPPGVTTILITKPLANTRYACQPSPNTPKEISK